MLITFRKCKDFWDIIFHIITFPTFIIFPNVIFMLSFSIHVTSDELKLRWMVHICFVLGTKKFFAGNLRVMRETTDKFIKVIKI